MKRGRSEERAKLIFKDGTAPGIHRYLRPRLKLPAASDYFTRKAFLVARRKKHPVVVGWELTIGFAPNLTGLFAPFSTHRETKPNSGNLDASKNLQRHHFSEGTRLYELRSHHFACINQRLDDEPATRAC